MPVKFGQIRFWFFLKGHLISKGLFAIFIWTKKRTKYFPISALKIWYFRGFVAQGNIYFFSEIWPYMGFFRYSNTYSYLFEWNIPPGKRKEKTVENKYFLRAEIQKYFVRFLVQVKIAKSSFEINWPLVMYLITTVH